ncbi:unnamed protein product [Calypogeia fissa]
MGNCQATADVVGVLVEHRDGRVEHLFWSVTARQIMLQYPGNYVALVPAAVVPDHKIPLRIASSKLKLLPPDATLLVGQHYRLVSFEDVLLELSEQKIVGRSSTFGPRSKRIYSEQTGEFSAHPDNDREPLQADNHRRPKMGEGPRTMRSISFANAGQWRPALQSISESGRLQSI